MRNGASSSAATVEFRPSPASAPIIRSAAIAGAGAAAIARRISRQARKECRMLLTPTRRSPSARQTKRTRNRQERARGHNTAKTRVSSKGCFRGQVFGALIDGAAPCWETQSDSSRSGIGISAPYLPEDRSRLQSQTQPTRGAAGHGYLRNTPQKSFCSRRPIVIDQRFDL